MTDALERLAQPRRSMGLKLLLVCGLAALMSIVALFVFLLLSDRANRAHEVSAEVGGLVGGPQTFLGPVLTIPYAIAAVDPKVGPTQGVFLIFPTQGHADITAKSEVRQRSLFKGPVYVANLNFTAQFDLGQVASTAPRGANLDWSRAELVIGASQAKGAKSEVVLKAGGLTLPVAPASILTELAIPPGPDAKPIGYQAPDGNALNFFGANAAQVASPLAKFDVTATMTFSGAERLAVLAFAKTTTMTTRSDWPHPSFDGGFLPTAKTIDAKGFTAAWSVPFIARGVPAQGSAETLSRLGQTALGISFVEPANPYQSVARSLKYAPLFLGLVFLAYFMFETAQNRRIHAAQYVLIGLAQIVFYLLLLSIAERLGFDGAFVIAAGATVLLISAYAGWVFESRKQGLIALGAFTVLYGLIYGLMRLEDLALLIGALASFAAIAAVMYFTRKIDWYGGPAPLTVAAPKETP